MANGVVLQIRITERYEIGTDTLMFLLFDVVNNVLVKKRPLISQWPFEIRICIVFTLVNNQKAAAFVSSENEQA